MLNKNKKLAKSQRRQKRQRPGQQEAGIEGEEAEDKAIAETDENIVVNKGVTDAQELGDDAYSVELRKVVLEVRQMVIDMGHPPAMVDGKLAEMTW